MSEHKTRKPEDGEDDDLELLRIAALKSINAKKDQPMQYHRSPSSRPTGVLIHSPQKISSYSNIPMKQSGNVVNIVNHDNSKLSTAASQSYYPSPARNLPMSQHRSLHSNVDGFSARQRLEQLDLNEPYVPQRVPGMPPIAQPPPHWMRDPAAIAGTTYSPYAPQNPNEALPVNVNVQLSPRSMAFVAQNNTILMRRKGENVSPNFVYRSPSPQYTPFSPQYAVCSPGRWSKSPSPQPKPKAIVRSPGNRARVHHFASHRRSVSRSPPNNHPRSPLPRCRSLSRSPMPHQPAAHMSRHQSPNPFNTYSSRSPLGLRQMKTRSSPVHNTKHKTSPHRRRISRSPPAHNGRPHSRSPLQPTNGRRSPVLLPRHNNRGRRSLSPGHTRKRSPQGPQFHDTGNIPQRYHPNRDRRSPVQLNLHRRSASPLPPPPRHRSHSRSPQRRFDGRSRERNANISQPPRRRSPLLSNRRRHEPATNGFRNNLRGRKRSLSPIIKERPPVRRSRTRSFDRSRRQNKRPRRIEPEERRGGVEDSNRSDSRRNDERGMRSNQHQPSSRRDRDDVESRRKEPAPNPGQPSEAIVPTEEKRTKHVDTAQRNIIAKESPKVESKTPELLLNPIEGEKQESSEDEDNDDGIDLFASEDSESENEGRFKSSSKKNERTTQAPTVSFAKLGESRPVEVKELADIGANGGNRGRERDRPDRTRSNYGGGRSRGGDHFRSSDNGRSSRERDRRNKNNSVRNGSKNRRDRDRERERERDRDRVNRADRDWDSPAKKGGDEKKSSVQNERPMFKSTFQALDNEGKTSRRSSRDKDREVTERKTASSSRRRNNSKDRRASPDKESNHVTSSTSTTAASTTGGAIPSTTVAAANTSTRQASRSSSPTSSMRGSGESGVSSGSKKPIHLRLGAKTNTFKSTTKKTSSSPWSGASNNNASTEKPSKATENNRMGISKSKSITQLDGESKTTNK